MAIQNFTGLGHVYHDTRTDTYNWVISDLAGIKRILNYFDKFPLVTTKYLDYLAFKQLVEYKDAGYHHKNSSREHKAIFDNLLAAFRSRNTGK